MKADREVCHCGECCGDHGESSGHSPVAMERPSDLEDDGAYWPSQAFIRPYSIEVINEFLQLEAGAAARRQEELLTAKFLSKTEEYLGDTLTLDQVKYVVDQLRDPTTTLFRAWSIGIQIGLAEPAMKIRLPGPTCGRVDQEDK